jgi:hypothetical protein
MRHELLLELVLPFTLPQSLRLQQVRLRQRLWLRRRRAELCSS